MKILHVRKLPHDRPSLLAETREYDKASAPPLADGWEEMTPAEYTAWADAQLSAGWKPPTQTVVDRWRVSKDTLISRVIASGRLTDVMYALNAQSTEDQFVWNQSAWFWSDNPRIRGMCAALGVDADALLAPDEFIQ